LQGIFAFARYKVEFSALNGDTHAVSGKSRPSPSAARFVALPPALSGNGPIACAPSSANCPPPVFCGSAAFEVRPCPKLRAVKNSLGA
jgi:hypothetical protein